MQTQQSIPGRRWRWRWWKIWFSVILAILPTLLEFVATGSTEEHRAQKEEVHPAPVQKVALAERELVYRLMDLEAERVSAGPLTDLRVKHISLLEILSGPIDARPDEYEEELVSISFGGSRELQLILRSPDAPVVVYQRLTYRAYRVTPQRASNQDTGQTRLQVGATPAPEGTLR